MQGERMPAAVLEGAGRLDVREIPVPDVGERDVLVEVDRCGVCGSDLHLVLEGWGRPGSVPGHEWTGTVVAVGAGVERWSVGDLVVGGPSARCGACRHCAAGRPSLCAGRNEPTGGGGERTGAFARYVSARESDLVALPAGLDPRAGSLAEPLSVAMHGLERAGLVVPGRAELAPGARSRRVLVLGAGPIGALSIAALRALGVDDVVCVEPGALRRQLALDVGAAAVRHPDELEVPTIAEPGRVVDGAVDVVLECSGHASAMEAGLAQLERGGTLVLVGAGIKAPRFDPNRILLNELVVTGAYEYGPAGFGPALELLAAGGLPVDRLVEPVDVALGGLLGAMRDLAGGAIAGKVLVKP